ncbi:MAG: thiolase domain-containing protein [Candidatus Nanopelagicales bacterium]
MSKRPSAYVAGIYEHPERVIPEKSLASVYLEIVAGVLADAGLSISDVDGFHTSLNPGGLPAMADLLGLSGIRHFDGTDLGGATYVSSLGTAARAIAAGDASVVLVVMAGLPRRGMFNRAVPGPHAVYEQVHGSTLVAQYALAARRHMHEFGTTRADLAEIKVASSYHASFNPHAMLPERVTIEQVLEQPPIAEPLHRMDCCVVSDGGGAFLLVNEEVARSLGRPLVGVVAQAETTRNWDNGRIDLTHTGAIQTGAQVFAEAGLRPADIDYASIYDSFTITVLLSLEDLGFCAKGEGGRFVRDGALLSPNGVLPLNTDGGGLSNNHPDMRGGMVRTIEAVRQLRGEAHPELQVPSCEIALVHGSGFSLGTRSMSATSILVRES